MTELFITPSILSVATTPPTPVADKSPVLEIFPTPSWTDAGSDEGCGGGDGVASLTAGEIELEETAATTTRAIIPSPVETQPPPTSPISSSSSSSPSSFSSFVSAPASCPDEQSQVELTTIRAPRPMPSPPQPVHTHPHLHPPDPTLDPTWWRYFYTSPPPNTRPRPAPPRHNKGRIRRRVQGAWADVARLVGAGCLWMLSCCGRCSRYRRGRSDGWGTGSGGRRCVYVIDRKRSLGLFFLGARGDEDVGM
ncbi:hypothetical protein K440DRAFT_420162 [Wilcoxina mikolae CBS 423.85]|nr:hypothetical protein K440DRAFT_420162 [Wilcoxina mikolae CBS 423.85]